jgi:hypothetical protein
MPNLEENSRSDGSASCSAHEETSDVSNANRVDSDAVGPFCGKDLGVSKRQSLMKVYVLTGFKVWLGMPDLQAM